MLPKGWFRRVAGVDATKLRCETFLIARVVDESARFGERAEFSESMEQDSSHFVSITVAIDVTTRYVCEQHLEHEYCGIVDYVLR